MYAYPLFTFIFTVHTVVVKHHSCTYSTYIVYVQRTYVRMYFVCIVCTVNMHCMYVYVLHVLYIHIFVYTPCICVSVLVCTVSVLYVSVYTVFTVYMYV